MKPYVGTVKFFNVDRGFGFIVNDTPGIADTFCHVSAVGRAGLREIKEGDRVSFTIDSDERTGRPCAGNLQLV
jgi:CspA family cold shock protein